MVEPDEIRLDTGMAYLDNGGMKTEITLKLDAPEFDLLRDSAHAAYAQAMAQDAPGAEVPLRREARERAARLAELLQKMGVRVGERR